MKDKRLNLYRVNKKELDEVCCDCGDYIDRQDCNKCPVYQLKKRL